MLLGIISTVFFAVCRFIIFAADLMQSAFANGAAVYNSSREAVNMATFTDWYFDYYNFVWVIDLIAMVFCIFILVQLVINTLNFRNHILKYIIGLAWLISALFNSVYLRDNILTDLMQYEICAQIGMIAFIVFILLVGLDMILSVKQGKIIGAILIVIYIALLVLESFLSTTSNYLVFGTINISIPIFIMIVYFVMLCKKTEKS